MSVNGHGRRVSVEERERATLRFLKERPGREGATHSEIYATLTEDLRDSVTPQAYYKILDRMVAVGKLDVVEGAPGPRRYAVAPYLHADNALTLDDVYELLEVLEPTDAIARVIDAREYFEERRDDTLRKTADALLDEEPVDLVTRFVEAKVAEVAADVEILRHEELRDREIEARVDVQFRELHLLAYRYLGLSRHALDTDPDRVKSGKSEIHLDREALREEIGRRVFGDRCITKIAAGGATADWHRHAVSGSDGSTHASVVQLQTGASFLDEVGHQVVTFNNSVVYLEAPPMVREQVGSPYYSVPMSRSAIDDRENRGMVLAPFMFRYLSESEYEHMAKCATDVVQWRADEKVFSGTARSLGLGDLLPRPKVHIRDGTITPQEREWGHYSRANEYGDMVREGITLTRKVLDRVIVAGDDPPVFAGAVKATQTRFFGLLLNWYIAKGSRERFGSPLDPHWDTTRAAHIADNEAMSILLSTLEGERSDDEYFVSFAWLRPFHTLTEFYRQPTSADLGFWSSWFSEKRDRELRAYEDGHAVEPPFLAAVADVDDDDFVYLCANADYVAFYIGHTGGDPPPVTPRYEFLERVRHRPLDAARDRVSRNVRLIVEGLHRTGLSADREHNYLSDKSLTKIIPWVVYEAHEKAKGLGRQLESELRSIVVANLQALRRIRDLKAGDVKFLPMSIRKFVERYAQVIESENDEPGRLER